MLNVAAQFGYFWKNLSVKILSIKKTAFYLVFAFLFVVNRGFVVRFFRSWLLTGLFVVYSLRLAVLFLVDFSLRHLSSSLSQVLLQKSNQIFIILAVLRRSVYRVAGPISAA